MLIKFMVYIPANKCLNLFVNKTTVQDWNVFVNPPMTYEGVRET